MFCPNCGKPIDDGNAFCQFCGSLITESSNVVNPPITESSNVVNPPVSDAPKPPKKKGLFFALGGIAAVLIAVVVLLLTVGKGFFMQTFASPESYYHYVEQAGITALSKDASKVSPDRKAGDLHQTGRVSLEISDSAKAMISSGGVDVSWLENASIDYDLNWKNDNLDGMFTAVLNGESLATLDYAFDLAAGKLYGRVPELSDVYIDLSQALTDSADTEALEALANLTNTPDNDTMLAIFQRYATIATNNLHDVQKGSSTLYVEGISENCTTLTVTIHEDDLRNIAREVCYTAKNDPDLKSLFTLQSEDLYQNFLDSIDDTLGSIDEIELDGSIVMTLYVAKNSEVHGRIIEYHNGSDNVQFVFAAPESGGQFGVELSYKDGWNDVKLSGTGSESRSQRNVSLVMYADGTKYCTLDFDGFDTAAAKRGNIVGKMTLKLEPAALEMMDIPSSAILSTLSLSLDFNNTSNRSDTSLSVMLGSERLATLRFENQTGGAQQPVVVTNSMSVDAWTQKVSQDGSLNQFALSLMGKLPSSLRDMLIDLF